MLSGVPRRDGIRCPQAGSGRLSTHVTVAASAVARDVLVRVNHVVVDQSPLSRRDLTDDVTALDQ